MKENHYAILLQLRYQRVLDVVRDVIELHGHCLFRGCRTCDLRSAVDAIDLAGSEMNADALRVVGAGLMQDAFGQDGEV